MCIYRHTYTICVLYMCIYIHAHTHTHTIQSDVCATKLRKVDIIQGQNYGGASVLSFI